MLITWFFQLQVQVQVQVQVQKSKFKQFSTIDRFGSPQATEQKK